MNTHLILHKVRGKPEFDMAEQVQIGDEVGWITTDGHRAYPYKTYDLYMIANEHFVATSSESIPDDWPDYIQSSRYVEPSMTFNVAELVASISPEFHRRW